MDTVFQVQQVHLDVTDPEKRVRVGESDWYEPGTTDPRALYKEWAREYGRCTGKMYQDSKDGKTYHVGYIFLARVPYGQDSMKSNRGHFAKGGKSYLCEMWCSWRTLKREPQAAARGLAYLPLAEQYEEA
jgi:hypothetical protein